VDTNRDSATAYDPKRPFTFFLNEAIESHESKIIFDELEWISPGDDIRFKCYEHGGFQLRLVEFGKSMVHADWCLKGHFAYIVDGELEVAFSEHSEVYQSGDAMFIPDGKEHKHRPKVLTDSVTIFTVEKATPA
jgi:quercetin dioxygenase-like cupin family protein